ncbi:PQQ-binding-like beta-propeller repeat protein [Verrucomicrobiales bacterium]|nr:PQQ-binding-like beta-propeller repeat protein [Verrucomicrobiales bacterium]
MKILIIYFLNALLFSSLSQANDWPRFRGPTEDGHAKVKSIPLKWSATENVKWKVPVPGKGWSSPVLSDGRVYLTTAYAQGDNQDAAGVKRELRVLGFDAENGKTVWDTKVFDQKASSRPIHQKNSHASPTPIIENGKVYVHFGHMGTACLDLKGEIVWANKELGYNPVHGNGGTPIVVGDLLIFSADAGTDPFIVALYKKNGKVAWKKPRSETPQSRKFSFSTPTLINMGGRSQIISPASGAVFSYDPKTGEELWSVNYGGWSVIPKPGVYKNMIFVGTGYERAHLLGIRVDEKSKGNVTDSHIEWEITKRAPNTPSFMIVDDLLYFISDGGIATCVDPMTGEVIWQERAAGPMSASPVHSNGKIYFLDEQGKSTVIRAGRKFEVLATNSINERTLASYAIGEGAIYIRSLNNLYRIGK